MCYFLLSFYVVGRGWDGYCLFLFDIPYKKKYSWLGRSCYRVIVHALCRLLIFFHNQILQNTIRVSNSLCIQVRPDILSGLKGVQTVCQGYQQATRESEK